MPPGKKMARQVCTWGILRVRQGEAEGTGHGGRNDAAVNFAVENPFKYIQILRVEDGKPICEIGSSGDHTGAFVTCHSDQQPCPDTAFPNPLGERCFIAEDFSTIPPNGWA